MQWTRTMKKKRKKNTRQQSSVQWRLAVQTGMILANNSAAIQENKIVKKRTLRDVSYIERVSVATDALAFSAMCVFACISQPHLNSAIKVRRILRLCDVFVVSFFSFPLCFSLSMPCSRRRYCWDIHTTRCVLLTINDRASTSTGVKPIPIQLVFAVLSFYLDGFLVFPRAPHSITNTNNNQMVGTEHLFLVPRIYGCIFCNCIEQFKL